MSNVVGLWLCARTAHAGCVEQCEAAYQTCSQLKATGCGAAGKYSGKLVSDAASRIPIPGASAVLGKSANSMTEAKCHELLKPCEQVRTTCYSECGVQLDESTGQLVEAPASSAAVPVSTLRVFCDQPRTLVYINGQRMGATPEDPLEPFVTPELHVGKYWIRLVSQDGTEDWQGEKDVEEGHVNAVEGKLQNVEQRDWRVAQSTEAAGDIPGSLRAYRSFSSDHPNSPNAAEAQRKAEFFAKLFVALEAEVYVAVAESRGPALIANISEYETMFGSEGVHADEVAKIRRDYDAEGALMAPVWKLHEEEKSKEAVQAYRSLDGRAFVYRQEEYEQLHAQVVAPVDKAERDEKMKKATNRIQIGGFMLGLGATGAITFISIYAAGAYGENRTVPMAMAGGFGGFGALGAAVMTAGLVQRSKIRKAEKQQLTIAPVISPTQAGLAMVGRF